MMSGWGKYLGDGVGNAALIGFFLYCFELTRYLANANFASPEWSVWRDGGYDATAAEADSKFDTWFYINIGQSLF